MVITELCPECGNVAYPASIEAIQHISKQQTIARASQKWYACTNKGCSVAYCSDAQVIRLTELNTQLWYKDDNREVPICYCSKLTRGEIWTAVAKGAITIDEVQKLTGKNITGKCHTENPLGECCRNVFLRTIQQAKISLTTRVANDG